MKLKDLDEITTLREELAHARRVFDTFNSVPEDTVSAYASVGRRSLDYGRCGATVSLLSVPKSLAVSAAKRELSKVIGQLRALGVEVEEEDHGQA